MDRYLKPEGEDDGDVSVGDTVSDDDSSDTDASPDTSNSVKQASNKFDTLFNS
jgi:hypothetical protein